MAFSPARILVVSRDPALRNLIGRFLTRQNYQVEVAEDDETAVTRFAEFTPNLLILDIDLPESNGYISYRTLLNQSAQSPTTVFVLVLKSRTAESDSIRRFSLEADDVIAKPFSLGELGVRVGVILKQQRTVTSGEQQCLIFEKLAIDPVQQEVKLNGNLIPLTALEFDLLYLVAKNLGRVWERTELIQEIWDYEYVGDQRLVDAYLNRIWQRLEFHQTGADNELLKQLGKQIKSFTAKRSIPSTVRQKHILVINDDRGHCEVPLDQAVYSIGRDPNCDICLVSQFVSRHHATLIQLPEADGFFRYRIVDGVPRGKPSAKGLLINGHKLQTHNLQHEDEIVFAPSVRAVYYRIDQDTGKPPDEVDIGDDDFSGGIAPVPRPWKPTPPPLSDEDAISPDKV